MHEEGNPHSWRPQSKIAFSLEVVNGLCYMSDMRENKNQFRPCLTVFSLTKASSESPEEGKSVMASPGMWSQNLMASGQRLFQRAVTFCILSP